MVLVGVSTAATFLYNYLNGQQTSEIITTSRVVWFAVISILSFLFLLFGLDKGDKRQITRTDY